MVDTSKWVYIAKNKVKPTTVDTVIQKVNTAVEDLRKIRNYHDAVVETQRLTIDNANAIIRQSNEEIKRADAAMNKIKELIQL